jgi:hypothetical protein
MANPGEKADDAPKDRAGGSGQEGASFPKPRAPSGLSSGLQPGGMEPGGGPGASVGSIGTGGGSDDDKPTGSLKREGE